MFIKQKGVCKICGCVQRDSKGSLENLCIDHDHTTGNVRGLLCSACNKGLGLFKDNIKNLEGAIRYLKTTRKKL